MNKIEGGPACEGCKGNGRVVLALRYGVPVPETTCPVCKGTGVKPLLEWTADECAEHWKANCPMGLTPTIIWIGTAELGEWVIGYLDVDRVIVGGIGKGETPTEALRAAVAAVAKERDE